MDTVVVIGVLVILLVGAVVIQNVIGRGTAMLTGAVTGNTRKRGLAAVQRQLDFSVPVSGSDLVDRVLTTLGISSGTANHISVASRSDDGGSVDLRVGNRFADRLQFVIHTQASDGGCAGFATAVKWTESSGQILATEDLERLQAHVRSAVESLGGAVVETRTS